jgi:hypothetical protein
MTLKAIKGILLTRNDRNFFPSITGGDIDSGRTQKTKKR